MERNISVKLNNIIFFLLVFFLITLPLKNNINSISIILLSSFSFFILLKKKTFDFNFFYKTAPFLLYFLIVCVSTIYSEDKARAFKTINRLLPFILFPFIFSIIKVNKAMFLKLIKIFILWITSLALYSHTLVLIKLIKNNDSIYNLFNSYYSYASLANDTIDVHSTYYAYFVIVGIVFLLYLFFQEHRKKYKILYIIDTLYLSFFILHLSVRTPIFALFLLLSYSIIYYFSNKKKRKKGILFIILLYILTSVVIYNVRITRYRFQHLFGFTYADGTHHDDGNDKLKQWNAAIKANKNKLIGNGIGDANNAIYSSNLDLGLKKNAERNYNAHNQFIQTYVGLGLIGTLVLFLLFLYYFNLFYRNSFFIGYIFICITFLLFQTESYLERHHGIALFTFMILFFLNYLQSETALKGNTNPIKSQKKLY